MFLLFYILFDYLTIFKYSINLSNINLSISSLAISLCSIFIVISLGMKIYTFNLLEYNYS